MSATKDGPLAGGLQRGSSGACKLLLDAATPEMFRRNAFRLTGLPVDAKTREITKRAEKLEIMGGVGFGVHTGALALETPPTTDQIREAIHRLKDPKQLRILAEVWGAVRRRVARPPVVARREEKKRDAREEVRSSKRKEKTKSILSTERLQSLHKVLRAIDVSTALPKAKLAKLKRDVMPALAEMIGEDGSESPTASAFANSIAISLRDISFAAQRNYVDMDTAVNAVTLALELAREPQLKYRLIQAKRPMIEIKKRIDQDKAKMK